ncbi:hypothetical protein Q5H93_00020 [Hymenobacter sp. ASUV-10]|uniref:ABC-three component systems C-terminal domain-containing protein n=1 Tax=Hymenobacter aranciens TaxID=3063996 RepID=A0ABT9B5U3_9BACT|nr:ABC-three component system protein [Hymenobacter sp. ASUV-10]MDO7873099.1 hypothetical protein [Hymenobacter sp. ASUV-10]
MHSSTRAYYELMFRNLIHEKRGDEFQDFFSDIMQLAHGGDFVRVRPWGRTGDRKNDGYIISTKELFQVYAPAEMQAAETVRKIREDFAGAVHHWNEHFTKWTFVHNAWKGVPPHVLDVFLELEQSHAGKQLVQFTPYDLREIVFSLRDEDIALVLGPAFVAPAPSQINIDEIRVTLEQVARILPEVTEPISEVDYGKLDANGLSKGNRRLILWGYSATERIARFLANYAFDPELGQKVAATLRAEYLWLKASRMDPDEIFAALLEFVSAHRKHSPDVSIAVLAHFFQTCDIFEAAHTFNE